MIKLENVNHWYHNNNTAQQITLLKDINLEGTAGDSVAILGKSGSGKSTLLSLIAGLESPRSGEIQVAQSSIQDLSENELSQFRAKNIGIIFQQFFLVSTLTALENVLLPLKILGRNEKESKHKAKELLSQLGLKDRLDHLPSKLSGGECQRVAIARAMIHEPKLILADEPSGNLDAETGKMVMDQLFTLIKKYQLTLILVTHDQELAGKCDRVLKLEQGVLH